MECSQKPRLRPLSKQIFSHSAGWTRLDRPHCGWALWPGYCLESLRIWERKKGSLRNRDLPLPPPRAEKKNLKRPPREGWDEGKGIWIRSGPGKPNQRKVSSWTFRRGIPEQKFDMWIVLVFLRKKHQNSQKNGRNSWTFSFWPFLWFGLPGRLMIEEDQNTTISGSWRPLAWGPLPSTPKRLQKKL